MRARPFLITPRWSRALRAAGDLFFPPSCAACAAPLPDEGDGDFCVECLADLQLFAGPACPRCGAAVGVSAPLTAKSGAPACAHCHKHALRFDGATAAGPYEGLLRRLVLSAKHVTGEGVATALGRLAAQAAQPRLAGERVDVVTCVPMHWRRRVVRQTNSAEVMCLAAARALAAPADPGLLRRTRATRPQASLPMTSRRTNLRGAFAPRRGGRLHAATVVLVDDVLTTGATCSGAAAALRRAGADRVVAVVAARSL